MAHPRTTAAAVAHSTTIHEQLNSEADEHRPAQKLAVVVAELAKASSSSSYCSRRSPSY